MVSESSREVVEREPAENTEVRAFRGFWGLLGSRKPQERVLPGPTASSPARPSLAARKRLRWVSRLVLLLLPRRVQGALGFPVSSSIGQSLSPEISVSPTKLHGKGSKRKQDDLDVDDSGDEEHPTWVEVLSMELADEGPEEDPDYEPSPVETDSEEYASHNNTESELQVSQEEVTGTVNVVATKVSSCI